MLSLTEVMGIEVVESWMGISGWVTRGSVSFRILMKGGAKEC